MIYQTLSDYLNDPIASERPEFPPGGSIDPRDDPHMTFLAFTIRHTKDRAERLRKLHNYAVLLEQVAPGSACTSRVLAWHEEILGAA